MERFRNFISKFPTGLLTGLTLIAILWLTLVPHPLGKAHFSLFKGADKVVHVVMFGFLTLVMLLDTMKECKWAMLSLVKIGLVAFACGALGVLIEWGQKKMGLGRSFEVLDILANAAGALGAGGIWAMFQEYLAKPS